MSPTKKLDKLAIRGRTLINFNNRVDLQYTQVTMKSLINTDGHIEFGHYPDPITNVNYMDFHLKTAMGRTVPGFLKKFIFNQFHFCGVIGPDIFIGAAVVDLKYITYGFFYACDRKSGALAETKKIALPCSNIFINPSPDKVHSVFKHKDLSIIFKNNTIKADTETISIEATLNYKQTSPLRLCTRAGSNGWVYTQKTTPVPILGDLNLNNRQVRLSSPEYMALTDWSAGYMRRDTFWNWAATACILPDGRSFGFNLSCGVNETSFTENALWINGTMTKIDLVNFIFNKSCPENEWHIVSNDKKVDLVFYPETHRGERLNALLIKSRFIQSMGVFNGSVTGLDGEVIKLEQCPGWVEDHYAKW